ncbi:MAG: hypothetical protein RR478_02855, partial [Bacilli bacterium]
CVGKRKRVLMEYLIDWLLYSGHDLILEKRNVPCIYIKNELLTYIDTFGTHEISLLNKTYTKKDNKTNMVIDFTKKECKIALVDEELLTFDIDCDLKILKNKIYIKYILDTEKRLVINVKE